MIKEMFSIIVPIYKLFPIKGKDKYEIDLTIESILDQDYKNKEIIVCVNGPDRDKIVKHLQDKYEKEYIRGQEILSICVTEEANAAIARNQGAKYAEGEFYSFLSGDTYLKPGALTIWKKAFDKHPEASIIYSDLEYAENGEFNGQRGLVPEYDRYAHECFNCIDGAMPCRAKYFKPWYPEVKALQDWAWSLAVTKDAPAVKIKDICYRGELPKEGGLSDHFSKNWLELNKQIKKIHGIPERKTVVTSLGAPFHALRTAKLIDADYVTPQFLLNENDYDTVYLLGYYTSNMNGHNMVFSKLKPECIRVIHWIGTDVMQMMGLSWEANVNIVDVLKEFIDVQLTEFKFTQQELERMQLPSEVLPLPLDTSKYKFVKGKPEKYTVAVYTPGFEPLHYQKYNLQLMIDIAKSMPDIDFLFFGSDITKPLPPVSKNVTFIGWTDIKEVATRSNVLLRFTPHDGLPMGPIEFLLYGREAITSAPVPGCKNLGTGRVSENTVGRRQEEIIEVIRECQKKPVPLKLRKEYAEQWKEELSPERIKKEFNRIVESRRVEIKKQFKKLKEDNKNGKKA